MHDNLFPKLNVLEAEASRKIGGNGLVEMAIKTTHFEDLLVESIDEALLSLGESARQSIYLHIEKKFQIRKSDMPKRLEDFQMALENIFGLGARHIEILVMKNLHAKIKRPFNFSSAGQLEFITYIDSAKRSFVQTVSTREV